MQEFLNATRVAKLLGIAKTSLYERIAHGDLAYHRVGRRILIRRDDFDAFLARTRIEARPQEQYASHSAA